jgi:epoxyqueuosine reductase QueG
LDDSFQARLERIAKAHGADLFGVADLTSAIDFICKQRGERLKLPRAISVGIHLSDAVVEGLQRHDEPGAILPYEALYCSVNSRLDKAAMLLVRIIQEEGYVACPIPASQTVDSSKLAGTVSHKLVANLAGLGWVGKNCLLITQDYGPRIRLKCTYICPVESWI